MNQNGYGGLRFTLSGLGFWITLLAIAWLLGMVGLGWLVKSFIVLLGLLILTPVIAFFAFRWWLSRNLVEAPCPVCDTRSAGINGTQLRCPNCGEALRVEKGAFYRLTPPGTIDVQAVEIEARPIEEAKDETG
ncbi:hypothetical protein P7L53_02685 [Thermoleptolyngbya sichuanensis XZ-Cy5]|uniref:hypothetical protein n=1 Tax=Thermoleptolyngbya sichuanensis TaxID=2885951 RepID=UPI00240D2360|nr:hypothetical protein [Thermoleptolyngbya sichuanensis]MDG2615142.1 hypothetical protein [Thermoleptolyngbya sichuanensis XZ-Cy5]